MATAPAASAPAPRLRKRLPMSMTLTAAATLVVAIGTWGAMQSVSRTPPAPSQSATSAAAPSQHGSPVLAASPAPPPVSMATVARSRHARAARLRTEFERSDDLYAFRQRHLPAAQAGDADALWIVGQALDYCGAYGRDAGAYARDSLVLERMRLRGAAAMIGARERVARRCTGFRPQDIPDRQLRAQWNRSAAVAGSLAAEAALMAEGRPLRDDAGYRRDLVERVQRSLDPEAYLALAPGAGAGSDAAGAGRMGDLRATDAGGDTRAPAVDPATGGQFSELAWQLAACRLGMDCTATGTLMTSYCVNGGICSGQPGQDFESFVYDAAIPRQSAGVVDALVDGLLHNDEGG